MTVQPVAVADPAEVRRLTAQLDALRAQIAPGANLEELRLFAQVCRVLDLDPFSGQICLVPRKGVHRHQITVAGRRALASRTGRLEGIEGPEWSGPRNDRGELEWRDVWDQDGAPYVARCLVHVAGWKVPANGTVKYDEFSQTDTNGKLTPAWAKMPSHMLGKVAEALALRRGFPEVAAAVEYPWPGSAPDLEGDDSSLVAEAAVETRQPPRGRPRAQGDRIPDSVRDDSPEGRGVA